MFHVIEYPTRRGEIEYYLVTDDAESHVRRAAGDDMQNVVFASGDFGEAVQELHHLQEAENRR